MEHNPARGCRVKPENRDQMPGYCLTLAVFIGSNPYRCSLVSKLAKLGYRHVSAYVERVRPGSPAAEAGIRADDLIIAIDGRRIADAEEYDAEVARLLPGQVVPFTLKRGAEIVNVDVKVGDAP